MIHSDFTENAIMFSEDSSNLKRLTKIFEEYQEMMGNSQELQQPDAIPRRLNQLLQQTCGAFDVTDPRDQLYALLGLLGTDDIPEDLQPDYALPVARVLHRYAAYLVEHTKDLRFLCFGKKQITGAPSWVPDWRRVNMGRDGPSTIQVDPPYVEITCNSMNLELDGVQLGQVATVVHRTSIATGLLIRTVTEGRLDDPAGFTNNNLEQRALSIIEGFQSMKSLCFKNLQSVKPGVFLHEFLSQWDRFWLQVVREDSRAIFEVLERRREFNVDELGESYPGYLILLIGHYLRRLTSAGMAILEGGQLVTAEREDEPIRVGDTICMLKGMKGPCILRKSGEHFHFVSVCNLTSFQLDNPGESLYRGF
jgi:hypothetical protein